MAKILHGGRQDQGLSCQSPIVRDHIDGLLVTDLWFISVETNVDDEAVRLTTRVSKRV